MKLGVIGLSGAGKSTVFEALTKTGISPAHKAENQIGTIKVPDGRVDTLAEIYRPRKTIHAQVSYLLPGQGSRKEGQNNDQTTWTQVRDCMTLIHVVRNFKNYGMPEPTPEDDFALLDQELILADLLTVEKRLERLELDNKRGKKNDPIEFSLLRRCRIYLENETALRKDREIASAPILRGFAFLSAKPVLVLINNSDEDDEFPPLKNLLENETCGVIRAKLEQELSQMPEEEISEFLEEFNIRASAMNRVIKQSYDILGLISFFTVGEDEVRAWTIKKGTPAVDAAGEIHTDIQKGFIRAEVLSYADLMAAGSYPEARKKGTVRLEGKTYEVQDGDIINFRFNV